MSYDEKKLVKNAVESIMKDDGKGMKENIKKALLLKIREKVASKKREYAKGIFRR